MRLTAHRHNHASKGAKVILMHQTDPDDLARLRDYIHRLANQRVAVAALIEKRTEACCRWYPRYKRSVTRSRSARECTDNPCLESYNERQNACPIRRLDRVFPDL